jgi:predicted N-acetyltransferase YhbS
VNGGLSRPVPLAAEHDCSAFDCGDEILNAWLVHRAKTNQTSRASRTYVTTRGRVVVGYSSLSTFAIARRAATSRVARNMPEPIPAILLGRLAVDRELQGTGLGKGLLRDAIVRTLQVADQVAVRVLVVHAINETACHWYRQFGFEPSPTSDLELMLLLSDARKTLGDAS